MDRFAGRAPASSLVFEGVVCSRRKERVLPSFGSWALAASGDASEGEGDDRWCEAWAVELQTRQEMTLRGDGDC